jgi:D-tagatose-1,6-bisphosphate aldolase subunit GatZ/KbaZ
MHWRSHYRGAENELRRLRGSSRLDRIRYYWSYPEVESALARLYANLNPALPAELIERISPASTALVSKAESAISPAAFIQRRIQKELYPYLAACR